MVYNQGTEVFVHENDGLYHERAPPISTLTKWETGWFGLDLELNQTYDILITPRSPDGASEPRRESNPSGTHVILSPRTEINQAGTYKFEIKNLDSQELQGFVRFRELWQFYEKPYFYYGIAGFSIALIYPVLILIQLLKRLKVHA